MTDRVSQTEINDIAWRACDTFRGTLDPAQYKDYILVMLFIKYMSDLWKDKREQYETVIKATRNASNAPWHANASWCRQRLTLITSMLKGASPISGN